MPLFMDRHNLPGVTSHDVAEAHLKDLKVQKEFGCLAMTYWIDEDRGNVFCLIESPDKEAVIEMHNRAHGLIPHDIIEVDSNLVKAFLGRIQDPDATPANVLAMPAKLTDPAFRIMLVLDLKDRLLFDCLHGQEKSSLLTRKFNLLVQQAVHHYSGDLIESSAEYLASFSSATNAVDCALNLRNSIQLQNTCENLPKVEIKIGLSGGFPVAGSKDLFGEAIKKASRLSFLSGENIIYLSSQVKDQYRGKATQVFNSSRTIRILNNDEDLFLDRLMDLFQTSIFEQGSTMEKYCLNLGVSASKLYRSCIQLTGLSPNDLLSAIRLNTALELMQKQNKNTSETSFELGFANPSYFTKCFKKKFSVLPADFIKSLNPLSAISKI